MTSSLRFLAKYKRLLTEGENRRCFKYFETPFQPKLLHSSFINAEGTSKTADFGFRKVDETEKEKLVEKVFTSVAEKYDIMNDLMSAGMHRLWKERLVSKLQPFRGMQHLDVAGGTGDIAFRIISSIANSQNNTRNTWQVSGGDSEGQTRVVVCDINRSMLEVGKLRAKEKGWASNPVLVWMEGNAEKLDVDDACMDGYTIAFGIRNVTRIREALKEAYRVLRPGGRFLCLELSHVDYPVLRQLYDLYSFEVVPRVGQLVTNDRESYQYLVESVRKFPSQERLADMIREAGFKNVSYENLTFGVVAIHSGFKL